MHLFDEEYKLILAFYLFDKGSNNDTFKINAFASELYKITKLLRSTEQIRYYLSCYKNVDTNYNFNYDINNEKFREYFIKFDSEVGKKDLKIYYKKFKSGLLIGMNNDNKNIINNYVSDSPELKKKLIINTVSEYPRDEQKKFNSFYLANFKCELDENHELFISKNDLPYLEGHHLIPLMFHTLFDNSLDVESNIVCLCPSCHKKLHYGKNIELELKKLYNMRKNRLNSSGLNISFDELKALYERRMKYDN